MSETKHTPGPWVVEDPIESLTPIGAHGRNGGKWVAHCLGPHQAANARLIAAAPDMLEALTALLARFDDNPELSELIGLVEIEHARAAIAKAEGRS